MYMPHRNEYASKQRYKHSYFKYKDEGSNPPDERTTSNHRVKYRLPEEEHQSDQGSDRVRGEIPPS